jgi:hypothetical protein
MALILRVSSLLLSSLAPCEDEPAGCHGEVQDLCCVVEIQRLPCSLTLCLLEVVGVYLVHGGGGETVPVFDLFNVGKALVRIEQSSDASQEATA